MLNWGNVVGFLRLIACYWWSSWNRIWFMWLYSRIHLHILWFRSGSLNVCSSSSFIFWEGNGLYVFIKTAHRLCWCAETICTCIKEENCSWNLNKKLWSLSLKQFLHRKIYSNSNLIRWTELLTNIWNFSLPRLSTKCKLGQSSIRVCQSYTCFFPRSQYLPWHSPNNTPLRLMEIFLSISVTECILKDH